MMKVIESRETKNYRFELDCLVVIEQQLSLTIVVMKVDEHEVVLEETD